MHAITSPLIPISVVRASKEVPQMKLLDEAIDANKTVFLIAHLDGFLLYAPTAGLVALVDEGTAAAVRRFYRGSALAAADEKRLTALVEAGFLGSEVVESASQGSTTADRPDWKPTTVTFSTTQKCTLRCTYCYAEGGRLDDLEIPWPMAKAAIDLIISNGVETGKNPDINFLGEGEATVAWDEFTRAVDYFKEQCQLHGFTPYVELSTNGIFPRSRVAYLAENCTSITFSVDGVAEVHDANRVLPTGKGSFALVTATMRAFDALQKRYYIRSTVGSAAVPRMAEFVAFIGQHHPACKQIHFEPIFDVTRVTRIKGEIIHPDGQAFVEGFRDARRTAVEYGIELYYSGSDTTMRHSFCGASDARNFLVTSRGLVTACNEVLQPSDPRAPIFHYGSWTEEAQAFSVDAERIKKLSTLKYDQFPKCQGCVAKFNCAGDCYARSAGLYGDPWSADYTYRCHITRELLKDNLMLALVSQAVGLSDQTSSGSCAF